MSYTQYSQAKLKEKYGADESSVRSNLVSTVLDLGANKIKVSLHKKAAPMFLAACRDYCDKVAKGKAKAYKFKVADCGTFCWRKMRGGSALSMHSFGIALDLNAFNPNGFGKLKPNDISSELVKSFAKYGIYWGGAWSYPDPMHFEYAPLSFPNHAISGGAKKYLAGSIIKTGAKVNVRSKPDSKARIVKKIAKGKKLKVIKDWGKYVQVSAGYIHEDWVKGA